MPTFLLNYFSESCYLSFWTHLFTFVIPEDAQLITRAAMNNTMHVWPHVGLIKMFHRSSQLSVVVIQCVTTCFGACVTRVFASHLVPLLYISSQVADLRIVADSSSMISVEAIVLVDNLADMHRNDHIDQRFDGEQFGVREDCVSTCELLRLDSPPCALLQHDLDLSSSSLTSSVAGVFGDGDDGVSSPWADTPEDAKCTHNMVVSPEDEYVERCV